MRRREAIKQRHQKQLEEKAARKTMVCVCECMHAYVRACATLWFLLPALCLHFVILTACLCLHSLWLLLPAQLCGSYCLRNFVVPTACTTFFK
jgi:hypothetical protein